MFIGDRIRTLREARDLSQGDIEKRTGLLRCYISRVECGHTVPSIETLERLAGALQVPLYELFYEGDIKPDLSKIKLPARTQLQGWGDSGTQYSELRKLRRNLSKMTDYERALLISLALKMTSPRHQDKSAARSIH